MNMPHADRIASVSARGNEYATHCALIKMITAKRPIESTSGVAEAQAEMFEMLLGPDAAVVKEMT